MKKKIILWIFVIALLAGSVFAQLDLAEIDFKGMGGKIADSAKKLGNFEEMYDKNPQIWDFLLYASIFALVCWLGLSKWFGDTNKGAATALAIIMGVLLGLGAVKAGLSMKILVPFVKNAFFFIVAGVIFFILINIEGLKEKKIISLLIALAVTFIIFNFTGMFNAIDTKGWLEGGREVKEMSLEEIHKELDKLATKYEVYNDKYRGISNDSEVKKVELKVEIIEFAIKDKIDAVEENEDENETAGENRTTVQSLQEDLQYLDELEDAGTILAKQEDMFNKELAELEKALEEKVAEIEKAEKTGATDEEKQKLKSELEELRDNVKSLQDKNEE